MKKLLYSALLAGCFQVAQAQTTPAPPAPRAAITKDDDTLLVELTEDPEAGWRRLAQVLMARGYSIEHSDKDLLLLSTHLLNQTGTFPVRVTGRVVNRAVELRMWETKAEISILRVSRRSGNNDEWRELEAIARDLGGTVRYSVSAAPRR